MKKLLIAVVALCCSGLFLIVEGNESTEKKQTPPKASRIGTARVPATGPLPVKPRVQPVGAPHRSAGSVMTDDPQRAAGGRAATADKAILAPLPRGANFPSRVPLDEIRPLDPLRHARQDIAAAVIGKSDGRALAIVVEGKTATSMISDDSGQTFSPEQVIPTGPPQTFVDSFSGFDGLARGENVYIATAIADSAGDIGMQFVHSPDFGQSWMAPVDLVRNGDDTHGVLDLRIDANEEGVIAVVYYESRGEDPYARVSTDFGDTWSPRVRLNPGVADGQGQYDSFDVKVDPSGAVHVAFVEDRGSGPRVFYTGSFDGGASFSPEIVLDPSPGTLTGSSNPVMTCTPGGSLLLAFRDSSDHIYVLQSNDQGSSFVLALDRTPANGGLLPQLFASSVNSLVLLTLVDGNGDLTVQASFTDGGPGSWGLPQTLATGTVIGNPLLGPDIAVVAETASGSLAIAYTDNRSDTYLGDFTDLFVQFSFDVGDTWGPEFRVNGTDAGTAQTYLGNTGVSGIGADNFLFVYGDSRLDANRSFDVFSAVTPAIEPPDFSNEQRIDSDMGDRDVNVFNGPTVATDGGTNGAGAESVYLSMQGTANGNYPDLFVATSHDGGRTFPHRVQVSNTSGDEFVGLNKVVGTSGNRVYVAYEVFDRLNAQWELRFKRSTDRGMTWAANPINFGASVSGEFDMIADDGGNVYVVWADGTNVNLAKSIDFGNSFAAPVVVNTNTSGFNRNPRACAVGDVLFVPFAAPDGPSAFFTVNLAVSTDGGLTFAPEIQLLPDDPSGGSFDHVSDCYSPGPETFPAYVAVHIADFSGGTDAAVGTTVEIAAGITQLATFVTNAGGIGFPTGVICEPADDTCLFLVDESDSGPDTDRIAVRRFDLFGVPLGERILTAVAPLPAAPSDTSRIVTDGQDNYWVSWRDDSAGQPEMVVRHSADGGNTWGQIRRLSTWLPQGSGFNSIFSRYNAGYSAAVPGKAVFVWAGARSSPFFSGLFNLYDVTSPQVINVLPANNQVNVSVSRNVTLTFSEVLDPATVNSSTIRLLDPMGVPVPAVVTLATDGLTVTLDPLASLSQATVYTVFVSSGVRGLGGNAATPFSSLFDTEDTSPRPRRLAQVADQTMLPQVPPPPGADKGAQQTAGNNLGFSTAASGLLNDDLLSDFIGGAPGYQAGSLVEAGAVIVALGSTIQSERQDVDVIYTGSAARERAGVAVASGFDFDGDGRNDLLIGAEQYNRTGPTPGAVGPGRVYLILFRPDEYDRNTNSIPDFDEDPPLQVTVSLSEVGTGITGAVIDGVTVGDLLGTAVAGGPALDNQAGPSIVLGAPGANNENGSVYVVFNQTLPASTVTSPLSVADVGGNIPGAVFQGSNRELLGASLDIPGDVTNPLGPDLAMGAPLADGARGRVYIAAGGNLTSETIAVSDQAKVPVQIRGNQAGEQLGYAVASGGDNRQDSSPSLPGGDMDLLIGAPFFSAATNNQCASVALGNAGRVAQTSGRIPNGIIDVSQIGDATATNPVEGIQWLGSQADGQLGGWVSNTGDVTGNGIDDSGLGAPIADGDQVDAGAVYLIEGSANAGLGGTLCVGLVAQSVSGTLFIGEQQDERAGLVLAPAGQIDGQFNNDFIVGAPGFDGEAGTIHQVLEATPLPPGFCRPVGCTVADLLTGAQLIVPDAALAGGATEQFSVEGLADSGTHDPACQPNALAGKTLVGTGNFDPNLFMDFSTGVTIDIPTFEELEYQLTDGETLDLRFCATTTLWTSSANAVSQQVIDNQYVPDRKAARALVNELQLWGVFFDDQDQDRVRDTCDCAVVDPSLWEPPSQPRNLLASKGITGETIFNWDVPEFPGGNIGTTRYDVIRSPNAADFTVPEAICTATEVTTTQAVEGALPNPGEVFYFFVRSTNDCAPMTGCRVTEAPRAAIPCGL